MKKWFFLFTFLICIYASVGRTAFARIYYPVSGNESLSVEVEYTEEKTDSEITYNFKIYSSVQLRTSSCELYYVDSSYDSHSCVYNNQFDVKYNYLDSGEFDFMVLSAVLVLPADTDLIDNDSIRFYFSSGFDDERVEVAQCMVYATCTLSSEEEPSVTPEVTPEVTPDVTPEADPTVTPTPTPTNTPAPTPTPTPLLQLHAYVDNNKAVAEYKTGGCVPIKSIIEFYEVDRLSDSAMKIDGENFLSGAGTRSDNMEPGKWYRYKLTYIFERDGVIFERYIWSEDLTITDKELDDYNQTGNITNFRTLILFIWNDLMDLEIPIEGYHVKIRSLFLWTLIAGLGIWFYKKWNGG